MKSCIKRMTAFLLVLCMSFSLLEFSALAEDTELPAEDAVLTEEADLIETEPEAEAPTDEAETALPGEVTEADFETEVPSESAAEAEEADIDEPAVITGFAEYSASNARIDCADGYKPTLTALTARMPDTLDVYLNGSDETTAIPVTWYCVGEDYSSSEHFYFQFSPQWDETQYTLDENLSVILNAPYIPVFLTPGNSTAGTVSLESGIAFTQSAVDKNASGSTTLTASETELLCYRYIRNVMGLSCAAACGMLANIYSESAFYSNNLQNTYNSSLGMSDSEYTAAVDDGTYTNFTSDSAGYGLCQWTYSTRKAALLSYAQSIGASIGDAQMQMEYLDSEYNNDYPTLLSALQGTEGVYSNNITNDEDGAYWAGYYICYYFERPANTSSTSASRGNLARDTYYAKYSGGDYDTVNTELSEPVMSSVTATADGIRVTWKSVSGADGYYIYRRTGSSSNWTRIGSVDGGSTLTFTDTNAVSGTTNTYTVAACADSTRGKYGSNTLSLTNYIAAPVLQSVAGGNTGITVTWTESTGAEKYIICRKEVGGSFKGIAYSTSTSYTDTKAVTGTTYVYTVRCVSSDGKTFTSAYNTTGLSLLYLSAPKLGSASFANDQVTVSWNSVSSAENYRVYRKAGSSGWVGLGNTTSTEYVDPAPVSGQTNYYTVRCISADGSTLMSGCVTPGVSVSCITTPVLKSVTNQSGSISLVWSGGCGSGSFAVCRKVNGGSWSMIATTTSTSYTDSEVSANTDYTYTVRCLSSTGKSYTSGYDAAGLTIRYLTPTVFTSFTSTADTKMVDKISWNTRSGVSGYQFQFSTSSDYSSTVGSRTVSGADTSGYTDLGPMNNTAYYFRIRTYYTDDSTTYYSAWSDSVYLTLGESRTGLDVPKLGSISNGSSGVNLSWSGDCGDGVFAICRKAAGSSSWKKVATTTSTSYTDTSAAANTTYTYTVRCLSADEKTYTSGYDAAGLTIRFLKATSFTSVTGSKSSGSKYFTVKWNSRSGVSGYEITYSTSSDYSSSATGTKTISSASTTSWTAGPMNNSAYYFRIRTYYTDGSTTYYSAWSSSKYASI